MNPDQGTELRSGRVINSSSETSSPIDPDMAQSSANDSDNNEASDISSQLSETRENYEKQINELQSEFSQLKNLLMAVISKSDENNLPSSSQSSSKPAHTVGLDNGPWMVHGRAWPHGSSSMILTHDSSMMSHVENFVRSRKFSLTVSVFVSVSLSKPQNLRVTLMARVALRTLFGTAFPEAAEIGRSFVSIRWVFDGFGDGF